MLTITRSSLALVVVLVGVVLSGCGSEREPTLPVSAHLVGQTGTSPGEIILSPVGRDRIGLQTAVARTAGRSGRVTVPYSALVYDPSGRTYVFAQRSPLTFVEVPARVDRIAANVAYLTVGPKAGAKVVTVGAEELYGVQTGVLAQT